MARNAIKVLTDKGNTSHILIKGTSTSTINALRRVVMSEVPTLAIEELSIYENNGVLFDEFLGHRLGLIPLTTDVKSYKLGDKIKISLDIAGPGTVYSKDIKIADPGIKIVDEKIPLTKLKADQRIRLEGEAIMGQGKDHVKFQPAVIGYRALPIFTIADTISPAIMEKIIKSCPVNIIETKGKKLSITEAGDCTLCGRCEEVGGSQHIQVDADDSGFILMMETHGGMSNKDILHSACNVLIEKTKDFHHQIEEGL
ncbi:MAG: DNA-directed RNA polymerase subunit D [Candidatus Diapherotrites archaeon]